jgi:hypothetical protein
VKVKTLLLTLTAWVGLPMTVITSQADDTEMTVITSADGKSRTTTSADYSHGWANYKPDTYTVTESPDGNTRTYDGTDYNHGWANYSPDKLTLHYEQEKPAATPSQNRVGYGTSRPAERAPQLYAQPAPPPAPAPVIDMLPSSSVVSAITSNRWTANALIVSGTLTNTNAVSVRITNISATGFNEDQKAVINGSDYTIMQNDLAPGETVNFKVALKDDTKQVKFVKVAPYVVQP